MQQNQIWLIGAGDMAVEYAKILESIGMEYTVIGRGEASAQKFESRTGHPAIRGGVERFCESQAGGMGQVSAIVTVYPDLLKDVTETLMAYGVKKILVEKPAGLNLDEIRQLHKSAGQCGAEVYVAYNRRFYSSVLEAKKIIRQDGGVTSFHFEFTEWAHAIQQYPKPKVELENWFMANSTHVADLAFYLGGIPSQISSYVQGELSWYHRASRFAGAGVTPDGVLFSYKANWASAGRWSLEVLTKERKLIFEPLEELRMMPRGSIQVEKCKIEDDLDSKFKPGLFREVKAFLDGDTQDMVTIGGQERMARIYGVMESNATFCSDDGWMTCKKAGA